MIRRIITAMALAAAFSPAAHAQDVFGVSPRMVEFGLTPDPGGSARPRSVVSPSEIREILERREAEEARKAVRSGKAREVRLRRGAVARELGRTRPSARPESLVTAASAASAAATLIAAPGQGGRSPFVLGFAEPDGPRLAWPVRADLGAGARFVTAAAEKPGVSAIPAAAPPPGSGLRAEADLSEQRLRVYEGGRMLFDWPISSGKKGFASSTGTFRSTFLSRNHRSRKYDGAPMPCAIFYNGGEAIHATNAVSALGRPASHGCLRLEKVNACELFDMVKERGAHSLTVKVTR